ncbi:MAG: protein-tyrosine phosphatase [Candidatus Aldehydirespiratoraceae bacterium]|jgi:protein-tyrosine phosphatase
MSGSPLAARVNKGAEDQKKHGARSATIHPMDIGGDTYSARGGVHVVPVAGIDGSLILCGLDAIGPDPGSLLSAVEAGVVVCLQTDAEVGRRFPDYLAWLSDPSPYTAVRLPTEDHLVADDAAVTALVRDIHARLTSGERVVVHCGAGWGRAGVIAVLVMCAAGADIDPALRDLRLARPAAGPQSTDQDLQIERLAGRLRSSLS